MDNVFRAFRIGGEGLEFAKEFTPFTIVCPGHVDMHVAQLATSRATTLESGTSTTLADIIALTFISHNDLFPVYIRESLGSSGDVVGELLGQVVLEGGLDFVDTMGEGSGGQSGAPQSDAGGLGSHHPTDVGCDLIHQGRSGRRHEVDADLRGSTGLVGAGKPPPIGQGADGSTLGSSTIVGDTDEGVEESQEGVAALSVGRPQCQGGDLRRQHHARADTDITGIRSGSQVGARAEHGRGGAVTNDESTAVLGLERTDDGEAHGREDNWEHTGRVVADQPKDVAVQGCGRRHIARDDR
jgi:hypothetical protein